MTEEQYYGIMGRGTYAFHLYYGKVKIGYILDDPANGKYYIVHNTSQNRNMRISEKGYEVELEQIDYFEEYNQVDENNKFQQRLKKAWTNPPDYDNHYYNHPRATKMIIVGAGASYNFSSVPITNQNE